MLIVSIAFAIGMIRRKSMLNENVKHIDMTYAVFR